MSERLRGIMIGAISLALVIVIATVCVNTFSTKKDDMPRYVAGVFKGDASSNTHSYNTNFDVIQGDTGINVVVPEGQEKEELPEDYYASALYIDMTADSGFYSGKYKCCGYSIARDGSGIFTYRDSKKLFYNQKFTSATESVGYVNLTIFRPIFDSNYMTNLAFLLDGHTYVLESKFPVYELNTHLFSLISTATSTIGNYGIYIVTCDVTSYFNLKCDNVAIDKPILMTFTVELINDDTCLDYYGKTTEKRFKIEVSK